MPCRDGGPSGEEIWRDRERERKAQQERLDKVTRLLCEVLTTIETHTKQAYCGNPIPVSDEATVWFAKHKEADRKRIAAEEKAEREAKKQLLDRAEKLKKELEQITKQLDKHK